MKYKTIGAFKNVQNIPYCKAEAELHVGMGVKIDRVNKKVSLPSDETEAKKVTYIVTNINDKPELHNSPETYVVAAGEYVRADDLRTVNGLEIEFAGFEIDGGTASVSVGDNLGFTESGLVKKVESGEDEYAVIFKVIAKTAYMDDGILAEIICQIPTAGA